MTTPVTTSAARSDWFPTTRWTLVVAARDKGSQDADDALDVLCRTYWYPLYAYARRSDFSREDAEDATQGFFAHLLQRKDFDKLSSDKGKFRAFLLASFKHFLSNERDRLRALKRGGGVVHVPIDADAGEARYCAEPADLNTPDKLFDRAWALTLLETVLARLRDEFAADSKEEQFDQLKIFLTIGKGARPYADVGAELGMSEGAVKVAVHRLRHRYRDVLKLEIAQTLSDPGQLDEELRDLRRALAE